jgi:hypothetical protein
VCTGEGKSGGLCSEDSGEVRSMRELKAGRSGFNFQVQVEFAPEVDKP